MWEKDDWDAPGNGVILQGGSMEMGREGGVGACLKGPTLPRGMKGRAGSVSLRGA
jgi:hypothetical protein